MQRPLLIAALCVTLASTSLGGTFYEVKCKDAKCGFTTSAEFQGVLMAERATGYCTTCKNFVTAS